MSPGPTAALVFRLARTLANVIIALCLFGVVVFFGLPKVLGWDLVVVLSGSMEPALPVGSVILVRPVQPERVRPGDVITYQLPGNAKTYVTHRVVEVQGTGPTLAFRTKGDANDKPDEGLVPAAAVKGTVLLDIPYLGYLVQEVRKPAGFLLLIGLPAAYIIAGEIGNIVREVRAMRARRKTT